MTSDPQTVQTNVRAFAGRARSRGRARACHDIGVPGQALAALRISLWFGLIVGLTELGLTLVQKPLTDPSPGLFRMNRHIVWTIPMVNLAVFGLCGIVAALGLQAAPRRGVRPAIASLVFLAVLTLLLSCRWLHVLACLAIAFLTALRLTRRIEENLSAFQRLVGRTLPAMGLVVVILSGFSQGEHLPLPRELWAAAVTPGSPTRGQEAPNVLLVVLDTVRADHLSLYGYSRQTSPNLSRLARRGVTFEQARSTAPWTLPSHASMMTGRWPHELSTGINRPLDGTHRTLAESFAAQGYATAGFVANATYCGIETGLGRGFAHFEDHVLSLADVLWTSALGQRVILPVTFPPERRARGNPNDYHRKDAAAIRRDMLAWVLRQGDRPFFAFLNLYDAHDPYIPPADFTRRFSGVAGSAADMAILDRWFIWDKKKLTSRQIQFALDAYDDGIAYLDEHLGLLFDDLERVGRLDNTLVIVTADHGEHLGEHQLYGHASSLYDAEIHVPLLIFLPGGAHAGQTVASQVSLRDLAATVADLSGLGDSPFPGRSLARYWTADALPRPEPSLSEVDAPVKSAPNQGRSPVFRGPMKAVASGNQVYIKSGDGLEELFDVESDPVQARDLSGRPQSRPILDEFRTTLERLLRDKDTVTPGSPEQ
ncbi:MAG: sulfatase [Isosphaeraceae bacterium]